MTDRRPRTLREQTLKLSEFTATELLIAVLTKVDREDGTPIMTLTVDQLFC